MISLREPEMPEKKYYNPAKLIKKYSDCSLTNDIKEKIAHNLVLLLNRPIEDFVRYHKGVDKDNDTYWLFYVDIDANTRYFFCPNFLIIRKKINGSYEHVAIIFYQIEIFRKHPIDVVYQHVSEKFNHIDWLKEKEENQKKMEKFV